MSEPQDRPSHFPWPPVVALAAIVAAAVLSILFPLPWFGSPLSDLLFAIGWIAIAAVVLLFMTALDALRRARTTIMANRAAEHLVTRGPYAMSRNPIYLANVLLMVGIALVAGWIWFLVGAVAVALLTQKLAIEPEERHLAARFGKKYRDYAARVRRWI